MGVQLYAQPSAYPYEPINPYNPRSYQSSSSYVEPGMSPNRPTSVLGPGPYVPAPLPSDSMRGDGLPLSNPTEEKITQILNFWLGYLPNPARFPFQKIRLWEGAPEANAAIKTRFSEDYQRALGGEYNNWRQTPQGRLALILLLDQFSRRINADQPSMFAGDGLAKRLALEGIDKGDDLKLFPIERVFFYMPFQHAENPEMQALSVKLYRQLVQQSPEPIQPFMQEFLKLAIKNQAIIDRFGRFPHRNKVLNRESTPEELKYLSQESALRY